MNTCIANTTCPICLGELRADRTSIADLAVRGYRGGRITCPLGCTDIWLVEPLERDRVECAPNRTGDAPRSRYYRHDTRAIVCHDCGAEIETKARNTIRCPDCRLRRHRVVARDAQRRRSARNRRRAVA